MSPDIDPARADEHELNDLPGIQDMGGRHGGQKGMPRPVQPPRKQESETSPTGQQSGDPVRR